MGFLDGFGLADAGSFISNVGGLINSVVNGPKRQAKFQKQLMQEQARLNEEAAEANQQRSLDLYNHQFQTQAGWDSSTAQRARAEAAGIGKASLGAEGAQPVASSAGSGASIGSSLPAADFAGASKATSESLSNLGSMFLQMKNLNSEIGLRDAQKDELQSRSVMQVSQSAVNTSNAALLDQLGSNEKVRHALLSIEHRFQEETFENRVDMIDSQASILAENVNLVHEQVESMKHDNRIKSLYGYKQARLQCDLMAAGVAVSIAQAADLWSLVGLHDSQAKYYAQMYINGIKQGVALDFTNDLNELTKGEQVRGFKIKNVMASAEYARIKNEIETRLREMRLKQGSFLWKMISDILFGASLFGGRGAVLHSNN